MEQNGRSLKANPVNATMPVKRTHSDTSIASFSHHWRGLEANAPAEAPEFLSRRHASNVPLLAWLASTPPKSPDAPMWHWIGQSIDAAMSSLPEMYAMFPMIAVQRYLGESGADPPFDDQRQQDTFLDVGRWRYFFIYGAGARFAEAVAVLFSPVHWVTLEWARRRVDRVTSARQRT
jgi:hypothetical protein